MTARLSVADAAGGQASIAGVATDDGKEVTSELDPAGAPKSVGPVRRLLARIPKHQTGLAAAIVFIGVYLTFDSPYFLTTTNLSNILKAQALTGLMAVAVTLVLLSGSVDVSMGGVLALSGMVTGLIMQAGQSTALAIVAGLAVATACGAVNAALVVGVGVTPLVATLGTQFGFRGLAYVVSNGESVVIGKGFLQTIGKGRSLGVPNTVWVFVATAAVLLVLTRSTRWGRHLYATGGGESAAKRSGVRTSRIKAQVFLLSGFVAGLAGVLTAGQTGVALPNAGTGIEFLVLGAIIVGGTTLLGVARGGVGGTILGILLFGVMFNGFNLTGISVFWQPIAQGTILIGAVVADELRRKRGSTL